MSEDRFICPVCGWDGLDEPAYNEEGRGSYEICNCCGYEYEVTELNKGLSFELYREEWIKNGFPPFFEEAVPDGWGYDMMMEQLKNIEKVSYFMHPAKKKILADKSWPPIMKFWWDDRDSNKIAPRD